MGIVMDDLMETGVILTSDQTPKTTQVTTHKREKRIWYIVSPTSPVGISCHRRPYDSHQHWTRFVIAPRGLSRGWRLLQGKTLPSSCTSVSSQKYLERTLVSLGLVDYCE